MTRAPRRVAPARPRPASHNARSRDRRDRHGSPGLRGRGSRQQIRDDGGDDPMGFLAPAKDEHRYQTCQDEYCERFACRVYQEGYRNGHAAGFAAGYAAGYGDGYESGYSDGAASGPDGGG